jgi:hypothetical protein
MVFLYSLVIGAFATVCCLWFVVFGLVIIYCLLFIIGLGIGIDE